MTSRSAYFISYVLCMSGVLLPSQKARQLILMPKSPSVCIYVDMSITVSYRHLARGLEIVSVTIPMASSCLIYLYNVLNSRFKLLPILRCTCGSQFGDRLRQSVHHFLLPVPVKIPLVHGDAGQMASVARKGFLVCGDQRHWGLKNPDCAICRMLAIH